MESDSGTVEWVDGTAMRVFDLEMPRFYGMQIHEGHQPGYFYSLHRRHSDGYAPGQQEHRTSASGRLHGAQRHPHRRHLPPG